MRCFMICAGLLINLFGLVSCGTGGGISGSNYNPGYGPFDANGNYVEAWADKPAKTHWWAKKSEPSTTPKTTKAPPVVVVNTPTTKPPTTTRPTTTNRPTPVAKVEPPSSPTPVAAKPKPKPKPPSTIRHLVKKGDTLYGLSRKYGTSVSSIQKANGLRGTTIVTGKTIKIPR